jgi:hypothetical protein
MSAQKPSGHNSEHISAETKASTGESQEPPAPPSFPEGSRGVFQQQPFVEDPEGIAPGQHSSQTRSQKWRVFWISVVLLFLISGTATGIMLGPRLYRIDTALNSATNQTLPHVKTTEQAIDIPTPTSLPTDLARMGHLNLLLLASDTDSKFAGGGVLTQTDMVVRIDFVHHHVTMLSLPRDLWIPSDEGYCCYKLDAHLDQ